MSDDLLHELKSTIRHASRLLSRLAESRLLTRLSEGELSQILNLLGTDEPSDHEKSSGVPPKKLPVPPTKGKGSLPAHLKQLRVSLRHAAVLLDMSQDRLKRDYIHRDEFTVFRSSGLATRGSRISLLYDEVEAFAHDGVDGLREFRWKKNRTRKRRRD